MLRSTSSSARLDSEVLLACALGLSRSGLIARLREPCTEEATTRFEALIKRRATGEPVAYIIGEREFWGLSFYVSPAVLVPRPESELIVEEAVKCLQGIPAPKFVDLGTGSGCLAVSIVHELHKRGVSDVSCVAIDRSPEALACARQNAERHGVSESIQFGVSDWFSARTVFSPPYHLIVANPPYIDANDAVVPIELTFEPAGALFSDDHGLRDVQTILEQSAAMLAPHGTLLCEVGAGKRALLREYFTNSGEAHITCLGDESPEDRFTVLCVKRPGTTTYHCTSEEKF